MYLKASRACNKYLRHLSTVEITRIDMSKVYKLFKLEYSDGEYHLNAKNYTNKTNYERLPRVIRYNFSERTFRNHVWTFGDYYDYCTDENIIILDYCTEFLNLYPEHIKTKKILKKLKTDYPEIFI